MKIHQLSTEEALQSLQSSRSGLPAAVYRQRLMEFGPNRLQVEKKASRVRLFISQFTHLFAILLWAAAGFAFYQDWSQPGSGMATLGWAILFVLLINGFFAFIQEYKAEHAISLLLGLLPLFVKVIRESRAVEASAEDLVPGDMIRIVTGDKVPADGRIIESTGLRLDESILTGESRPVAKTSLPDHGAHIESEGWRSSNIVMAGTLVISGHAEVLIFATGARTEFGRVVHLTETVKRGKSPLQHEITDLSKRIGLLSISIGVLFFILGRVAGLPVNETALFAIGVLVANVPEGLLPTVTLALAMAAQRMAKRNAIVRHLPSVETLGSVNVICTDKTGTLTENKMSIARIYLPEIGALKAEDIQKLQVGKSLGAGYFKLLEIARNCHDLEKVFSQAEATGKITWRGDPLELALVSWAEHAPIPAEVLPKLDEIPFDSDRRRLTTFHPANVLMKGAIEAVLPSCNRIQGQAEQRPISGPERDLAVKYAHEMAQEGLRVLAFASGPSLNAQLPLKNELTFIGLIGFEDPPRHEVPQAIQKCFDAGIRVIMVTGDHPDTAISVAKKIGLSPPAGSPMVISGEKLRHLSESQLQVALDAPDLIFARVDSTQKVEIVRALKRKQNIVAVTGDGVNDAPALKDAHIGIAMGASGTDVAREAADIVLLDNNFATIVSAVEEGRAVFKNIRKFLMYILTSNVPELVPYLLFILAKVPLPLTVIQILAVDLGTDLLPALALGAEPPTQEVMKEGPRPQNQRLANKSVFLKAYLALGLIEAIAALSAYFYVLIGGGWKYGEILARNSSLYLEATTACLATIVVMQVANIFVCRAESQSVLKMSVWTNPLIFVGIAFEVILILSIVYTKIGNLLFATAPFPWETWLIGIPFALGLLVLNTVRKRLFRLPCKARV